MYLKIYPHFKSVFSFFYMQGSDSEVQRCLRADEKLKQFWKQFYIFLTQWNIGISKVHKPELTDNHNSKDR